MNRPATSLKPSRPATRQSMNLLVLPHVRAAVVKEAENDRRSISRTVEILLEEALAARASASSKEA